MLLFVFLVCVFFLLFFSINKKQRFLLFFLLQYESVWGGGRAAGPRVKQVLFISTYVLSTEVRAKFPFLITAPRRLQPRRPQKKKNVVVGGE